ncbi:MAG: hypothetical protein AAFR66_14355 [Bacteroidota bacterium]
MGIRFMLKNICFFLLGGYFFMGCNSNSSNQISFPPQKAPNDLMFRQRAYPTGEIDPGALKQAISHKRAMMASQKRPQSGIWEFVGPENIGGRITDIEIPVDQSSVYYVGAASGGIFKTTNAGRSWTPIFDEYDFLSIGDMEISKANTDVIWVGTGESNAGGGSLAYDGNGIYRSTNAGLTWTNKGLSGVGSISKVLIDPNDDNTLYVSAMGPLFKNDANRGVYKSTDNGASWDKVLFVSDSTGFIDMAIHPTNSDTLYAVAWERIRRPQFRKYGGETSGIYQSTNGGASWTELTDGLPTQGFEKGRISIAIAPSNPNVLYARYANANGGVQGVFRTSDGGDNWNEVNSSQLLKVGFHWWFRGIYVDPADEDIIYNVDFVVQKSVNGGNSWFTAFPDVHVDQHALAFNAQKDNEILLGNDGGVYRSNDDGASSTKFTNLPITQFYRMSVDPRNPLRVYGGSQDNSTMRTRTGRLDDWEIIFGGDGFQPLLDPNNSSIIYALAQRGAFYKSINDGASFMDATDGIAGSDRNNWDTPVIFDPQDSRTLYYGTNRVWKTEDATDTWFGVSPDLTNGSGGGNLSYGTITSMDVSPLNSDVLVVGTDDANVWITQNGGSNWAKVSDDLPTLWTTKVLADRDDENTFYVTFSGYRYGQEGGHVYKSTNAGDSWKDIGSGLPDIPVNDIVKDAFGKLHVATDVGVFSSDDEGENWAPLGVNMPSVVVTDLHIQETEGYLYAATYGRSAYKININQTATSIDADTFLAGLG